MERTEQRKQIDQRDKEGKAAYREVIDYIEREKCISGKILISDAKKDQSVWNMMEHNGIYGLAPFDYYYLNDMVCFQYDVSSYHPVSEILQVNEEDFGFIFFLCREVLFVMEKASEYMIKEENFLLKPEWIFVEPGKKHIVLCCLPGRKQQGKKELLLFLEFIMEHISHKDRGMVECIYGLYDLLGKAHTSLEEALDLLDGWSEKNGAGQGVLKDFQNKMGENENRNGTDGEKTFYEQERKEKIWLLGREKESDICIPFLTVSRKHMQIIRDEDRYFVMDLASKNGTILNGKRLLPMQRAECTQNDILCIGGVLFSLHIASSEIKLCIVSAVSNRIWRRIFLIKNDGFF